MKVILCIFVGKVYLLTDWYELCSVEQSCAGDCVIEYLVQSQVLLLKGCWMKTGSVV